jgi:hypothetical protein
MQNNWLGEDYDDIGTYDYYHENGRDFYVVYKGDDSISCGESDALRQKMR